jgi:4'-phosphopantetheinyl transferase
MNVAPARPDVAPWRAPPADLVLARDGVHVWRAALDRPPSQTAEGFLRNLAEDERARAGRLYFERDREHFIVARGVLRAILGRYLNREPHYVSFRYNSHGKPALAGAPDADAIRFNVSHSHGLALYAVARGREVGIDVERIRCNLDIAAIAERYFSRRDVTMLRDLPADERHQAFFRVWTRKEAYVKAQGEGLSLLSDRLDLVPAPGEPEAVASARCGSHENARWSFQELVPAPSYVAALAVEGRGWHLSCLQWSGPGQQSV